MRESGILCPIFSLSSRFGIGCFSKEAYEFVDFLWESGQGYWQILPVGPTGFGDSPYQPFSAFAGNPYFISPEALIEEGLLTWDECNSLFFGSDEEKVDYGALFENRRTMLRIAFSRFTEQKENSEKEYREFLKTQEYWLDDYCFYMAVKNENNGAGYLQWEEPLRKKDRKAIQNAKERLADEMDFYRFCQFKFQQQWTKLHAYAASKNVKIIGDIPFYVSMDSSDVFSHPETFLMDRNFRPTVVAGCPPDAFSADGQLWGNPIYDWKACKKNNYDWWINRIRRSFELYDVIRIDHFHGFAQYYAIPYEDETAKNGTMEKGPGMDFFNALTEAVGPLNDGDSFRIIAEDLGTVTEENKQLLKDSKIPGMKILQYAFTSWDSIYMPYRHDNNSVVYTCTHDNIPTRAWLDCINDGERDFLRRYLNSMNTDYGALMWDMIRECYRSVCDLSIVPLQDYLVKGAESRINTPGAATGNWQWRLKPGFLSQDLARSIRLLTETYGRLPKEPAPKEK